jgi:hypothetical protein
MVFFCLLSSTIRNQRFSGLALEKDIMVQIHGHTILKGNELGVGQE